MASAAIDIAMGTKALGLFIMVRRFIASPAYTQTPTTQTEPPAKRAAVSVVKADDPGNLPSLAIFPPNHHKLEGAAVSLALVLMAKLMFPDLDGSVTLDRIDLEAALHQFSPVFRGARKELGETFTSLRVIGQSARVVIKLQIVDEERHQLIDVMAIEGLEDRVVEPENRVESSPEVAALPFDACWPLAAAEVKIMATTSSRRSAGTIRFMKVKERMLNTLRVLRVLRVLRGEITRIEAIHHVPKYRSPASPKPGTMKPRSSSLSSSAAV